MYESIRCLLMTFFAVSLYGRLLVKNTLQKLSRKEIKKRLTRSEDCDILGKWRNNSSLLKKGNVMTRPITEVPANEEFFVIFKNGQVSNYYYVRNGEQQGSKIPLFCPERGEHLRANADLMVEMAG